MKKQLLFFAALAACSTLRAQTADTLTVLMDELDDIVVVAQQVRQTTANHQLVDHNTLNAANTGQNLPYLLSMTPGIQVTSDDGLGVGYSYFRLRGTDHTRINITLNDVPLNDQESQTVFWVNMTDLASSLASVDIQRGVGTSTNGIASFGGSLNLSSQSPLTPLTANRSTLTANRSPLTAKPSFSLSFNGGMYNTFRETASAHLTFPLTPLTAHGAADRLELSERKNPSLLALNARFSKVNSDGFLYRATSDLYSYFADFGWYAPKTQVVLSVFGGSEKTGMAWDGVDYKTAYGIDGADRRYNPAGEYTVQTPDGRDSTVYYDNQTDNYAQQHVQLHAAHAFNRNWSLNATVHYTHGAGYYEQYKKKSFSYFGLEPYTDENGEKVKKAFSLYRKHLDSHFCGGVLSAKYVSEPADLQLGAAANSYRNNHRGTLPYIADPHYGGNLPVNYEYYSNVGTKADANIYAKTNWRIINRPRQRLTLYADLQYRFLHYAIQGINDEDMSPIVLHRDYHFFNPKAGLTYELQFANPSTLTAYPSTLTANRSTLTAPRLRRSSVRKEPSSLLLSASFAIANREPSRANFTENIHMLPDGSFDGQMPRPERLYDYELGCTYSHPRFALGLNLYFMDYDNQLVLTGTYNDVGAMSTTNVKDSYRMGIELTAGVQIMTWLRWDANLVLSRNKILNYTQTVDIYDANYNWLRQETWSFRETTIAFSPTLTAMSCFSFDYQGFTANIQTAVTSRQFLDNTMHHSASLRPYSTTNLHLTYQLPLAALTANRSTLTAHRSPLTLPTIRLKCSLNNIFNARYASNGGADASYLDYAPDASPADAIHPWPWFYAQAAFNLHAGFTIDF